MDLKKINFAMDNFALIIIGVGVSLIYYIFEITISAGQSIKILITIGIILLISTFTQILLNSIKKAQESLKEVNSTLEKKVKKRTTALKKSEAKYRTIFENTGAAIVIIEEDMKISLANSVFINLSGYEKDEIEDRMPMTTFIDVKGRRKLFAGKSDSGEKTDSPFIIKNFECKFFDKNKNNKDIFITFAKIPGTEKNVVSITDISELKEAERQIHHQAFHDSLTGLPNRALFMEHLIMAIKRGKRRENYFFAVIYLDIDRFKLVNDSLGHNIGDKLLVEFAKRIQDLLRDIDTLARFGGDEFVILLEDMENENYAVEIAKRLQKSLKSPFEIKGNDIYAPASFGIVLNTRIYDDPEIIIRNADAAMYHAKEKGRSQFKIFDKTLHEKALSLLQIETDLRKAIANKEFDLYYQPIVSLDNISIIGFEALIRWNHPTQGLVYPDSFIPVAEETGLIIPIGRWVLKKACRDLRRWDEQVKSKLPLFMSVNISSKQFLRPSLIDDIKEILDETGLPPDQLKLEITETALMEDVHETIPLIQRLKDLGVQIVIDDFGTGYSSMSYLQQLPIDTLKVDQSFISRIENNSDDESKNIVETIVSLALKLGLKVVAEGVETNKQHSVLSQMNCQMAQGFLFSKPLEKKKMDALIEKIEKFSKTKPNKRYSLKDLLQDSTTSLKKTAYGY
ncbi:MAG: EAL domain-containing protein [Desulfobacterales bacterium]|nr:EAL domain-containing protein [Desulfobacterales bacterium]MDX2509587.1 EAL domain-containing protein [Desulfobacterales bacterium]